MRNSARLKANETWNMTPQEGETPKIRSVLEEPSQGIEYKLQLTKETEKFLSLLQKEGIRVRNNTTYNRDYFPAILIFPKVSYTDFLESLSNEEQKNTKKLLEKAEKIHNEKMLFLESIYERNWEGFLGEIVNAYISSIVQDTSMREIIINNISNLINRSSSRGRKFGNCRNSESIERGVSEIFENMGYGDQYDKSIYNAIMGDFLRYLEKITSEEVGIIQRGIRSAIGPKF